jgi:TnpA family transposase
VTFYTHISDQYAPYYLVVAAIALWNTVYLERAISTLQERSYVFDQPLLHTSPH